MATTVQFNGRTTAVPGSYSEVDASGLARVGVGATGVIALLGEVSGGAPYSAADADFAGYHRISNPGKVRRVFREGDMVEAASMLFDATKDPNIPSSAQEVLFVKVNPATQSSRTLLDVSGAVYGTVTSVDYGLHTTQVALDITDGTTGKDVVVYANYAGAQEEFLSVGGAPWWTLSARIPAALGALSVTLSAATLTGTYAIDAGLALSAIVSGTAGSIDCGGCDDEPANPWAGSSTLTLVSASAADTGTVIVYGTVGGFPASEAIALNGTTPVITSSTWSRVHGIYKPATTGVVSATITTGSVAFETLPAPETWGGAMLRAEDGQLEVGRGNLAIVADAATTATLLIVGSAGGSPTLAEVTLAGTTPVSSAVPTLDYIVAVLGYEVPNARTVTITGNLWSDDTAAQFVSDDAADDTALYLFGLNSSGALARELVRLDGTTPVTTSTLWDMPLGWMVADQDDAAPVGAVTLQTATDGCIAKDVGGSGRTAAVLTHLVSTAGALSSGRIVALGLHVGGGQAGGGSPLDYDLDGVTGSGAVYLLGEGATGAFAGEVLAAGATDTTAGTFSRVDAVCYQGGLGGATDNAQAWPAFTLTNAEWPSLQAVADFFGTFEGVAFSLVSTKGSTLTLDDADQVAATSLDATVGAVSYYGTAYDVAATINARSQYVRVELASTYTGAPANGSGLFLTGGIEGATTFADWQAALDLLKGVRCNTVLPLTSDSAVHAAAVTHAVYMAGPGRSERDVVLGAASGETLTQLKTRVRELNTRHARMLHQDVVRFNTLGVREQFPPYFTGCLAAGMQSGAAVGEPLTWKYINLLGTVGNDASYRVIDDLDEMIQAGLNTVEEVPGIGYRWARGVTTYLIDNNLAYIEASTNHAVNLAVFEFRRAMEVVVGRKAFDGTVSAALGAAVAILGQMLSLGYITAWRNVAITLEGDVMTVDVEIAPVTPTNFVLNTLHLVPASFAAAA